MCQSLVYVLFPPNALSLSLIRVSGPLAGNCADVCFCINSVNNHMCVCMYSSLRLKYLFCSPGTIQHDLVLIIFTYVYAYVCAYIYIYTHTHTHIHTYIHTYIPAQLYVSCAHACVYVHACIRTLCTLIMNPGSVVV